MLERVGQALLDDAVGGEVDAAREREGLAVDVQPDGQAGAADLVQQRVEAVEARLGHELDLVLLAAHGGQQAAHLGERRPAGPLDAPERVAVLGQRVGKLVPDRAHLEHHHADRVGDDVVELAGDPRALLGHRDARRRLALPLRPDRADLGRLGLLGALAQREARDPGDRRTGAG